MTGTGATRKGSCPRVISTGEATRHPSVPTMVVDYACSPSSRSNCTSFPFQNCPCLDDRLYIHPTNGGHCKGVKYSMRGDREDLFV